MVVYHYFIRVFLAFWAAAGCVLLSHLSVTEMLSGHGMHWWIPNQKDLSNCSSSLAVTPAQMASAAESCLVPGRAFPGWPADSGGAEVAEAQVFGTNKAWGNSDGLVNSGAPVNWVNWLAEAIQNLFFFSLILYLLTGLGLCCYMWAFSSCGVWASYCDGFSCCRAGASRCLGFRSCSIRAQ